jgi:hypothetical protein
VLPRCSPRRRRRVHQQPLPHHPSPRHRLTTPLLLAPSSPTPPASQPLFAPIGATVPLPPRVRPGPRPRRYFAPPSVAQQPRPVSRPDSPGEAHRTSSAAGRRPTPPQSHYPSSAPGVSFCNFVLLNYYTTVVPAARLASAPSSSQIWLCPTPGSHTPNSLEVRNALNFCFSIYPHPFPCSGTTFGGL